MMPDMMGAVDVVALANCLQLDLRTGADKGTMLRAVRQFVMEADRSSNLPALLATPPDSTGDERWDSMIAGVVEDVALRHNIPTPPWAVAQNPLTEWWFVTDYPKLHPIAFVETPAALAWRGVFMRRASLENI